MKFKVQLLNYDSDWVDYCITDTKFYADKAVEDLRFKHNFEKYQVKIVMQ